MRRIIFVSFCLLFGMTATANDHHHHDHDHSERDQATAKTKAPAATATSSSKPKNVRRLGAHEHGVIQVDIAIEGKKVKVAWDAPAESVYGFEHEAKSDADKKRQKEGIGKLENEFFTMFAFAKEAGCSVQEFKYEIDVDDHHHGDGAEHGHQHHSDKSKNKHSHGTHSEIEAEFELTCKGELANTELKVDVAKVFPNVKTVRLTVLSSTNQTAKTMSKGQGSIKL